MHPAKLARNATALWKAIREKPIDFTLPLMGLAVVFLVGYVVVPYPWALSVRSPTRTAVMEQRVRENRRAGDTLEVVQDWVPLDKISENLLRAVTVAEDHRFREHRGVDWRALAEEVRWTGDDDFSWVSPGDWRALAEALSYVWSHRDELRGRSTITQQLAKNLYFGTNRSLIRKALEVVVARRLERQLDKDRILELYLNVAEWGRGIFGAEAAARAYFGVPAASLTLEQAAALAATLPHPLTSNPARNPRRMLWRRDLVLERLRPSAGVPIEPLPLPDVEIPEPQLPSLLGPEVAPPDSLSPDSVDSPPDTLEAARTPLPVR